MHLLSQPVHLPPGVAENDSLGDSNGLVQITQGVQLPFLFLNRDVKLLDTFECQLVSLDKNSDWVTHEFLGDLQHIIRHGGRKQNNLGVLWEKLEHYSS